MTSHNEENGFCALRVKARGHRDLVTLVGHAATIAAGEAITASGLWVNDRTHGLQFKAHFLKASTPSTAEGIRIGPVYTRKLVRGFGEAVFEVIENAPERLHEVQGIGPVRAERIVKAWAEQKMVRETMVFLHSHGVGTARAVRIFKTYGADAIQVMSENPYRLARDIRGIGFKTADAIADRLSIEKAAMIQVRAGIGYVLSEAMQEVHCGLPIAELLPLAEHLLGVSDDLIRTALDLELVGGGVISDRVGERDCVFLAGLYQAERGIAERLHALVAAPLPWPGIDTEGAVDPRVRQTNIDQTICVPGWDKSVRPPEQYTESLKRRQIREYGYANQYLSAYEEDHLIPPELGGAPRDPRNIWPDLLHRMVCEERLPLDVARRAIARNWIAAYQRCHQERAVGRQIKLDP